MSETFRCGHPKEEANTYHTTRGYTQCRTCRREQRKQWSKDHPDKQREHLRRYNQSEKGKQARANWEQSPKGQAILAAHKEKSRAQHAHLCPVCVRQYGASTLCPRHQRDWDVEKSLWQGNFLAWVGAQRAIKNSGFTRRGGAR